jgi:hypothetical protein
VGDFTKKDVTIDQLERMIVEGKSAVDELTGHNS